MNFVNSCLFYLSKKTLSRNFKFKHAEINNKCFIIGNGDSLKYYNLKNFSALPSIGCNSLFFHKDFESINCKYYFIPAPYMFYPLRKFYNKIYWNYFSYLYKEKILKNPSTNFFINLADRPFFKNNNTYYCHHFQSKRSFNLDGSFSYLNSSLHSMIAGAIYFGFDEVILVGCDYLFTPPQSGHFFEKANGSPISNIGNLLTSIQEEFGNKIKIKCMVHKELKSKIDCISYESFFNEQTIDQKNYEIVNDEILQKLDKLFYKTM